MAGYNYTRGMSNNAVDAYRNGKKPLSKFLPKLRKFFPGITVEILKDELKLQNEEYHHTGKFFNETIFVSKEELWEYFAFLENRQKIRDAIKKINRKEIIYTSCTVNYLQWSGSRSHPHCEHIVKENCAVIDLPGQFFEIVTPSGQIFRKKDTTNGLRIVDCRGYIVVKR